MMYQLRNVWNVSLAVALAHCDEIKHEDVLSITKDPSIQIIDICPRTRSAIFGMRSHVARNKLRGFFCKPAAVLVSPFTETMLVDLDVIWLKSPDRMFYFQDYLRTGTLFFRDRFVREGEAEIAGQNVWRPFQNSLRQFFERHFRTTLTSSFAKDVLDKKNDSFFWWPLAEQTNNSVCHIQDSSVVLIHRKKASSVLRAIRSILPAFEIGWGDKEIFWVAASLSGVEFSFEKYFAGSYGDCGFSVHFDQSQQFPPEPLFINAEHLVEDIPYVGAFVQEHLSYPLKINFDNSKNMFNGNQTAWDFPVNPEKRKGCTFPVMSRRNTTDQITSLVLMVQYMTAVVQFSLSTDNRKCISVLTPFIPNMNKMIQTYLPHCMKKMPLCPQNFPLLQTINGKFTCINILL